MNLSISASVLVLFILTNTTRGDFDQVEQYDLTQLIPIELSAVGRVAKLGELYDARADQFLHLSIVKSNFPNSTIASTENRETKLKYTLINTFEEKFQTLDVSAEVKLSVLGGMFELQGSGRYFKDAKTSARSAKASLIQSFSTTYDMVSITDQAVSPLVNDDVLAQIDATHVVVGIQWGGNVFISVEDLNQEGSDAQQVEGNLGVKIKLLAASLSGHGAVNVSDADKKELSKFSFEIYGDLLPDTVPATLIDAVEFMKKSPSLLQNANGGKGKAMKYTLLPLPALRKLWKINSEISALVNKVDETTIKNCVKLFDEMNSVGQRLNDIASDVNAYQQYISSAKVKQINDIKYNYEIYQAEVQRNLSEHLVKVRAGDEKVAMLQNIIIDASNSPDSWQSMETKDLTMYTQEVSFIKLLLKIQIILLDKTKILQQFLWENFAKDIYIMFFNYDPNIIADKTLNLFRKMIDNKANFGPEAMFVAIKYDILQDQNSKVTNRTNKISLYRNGTLIIDNYQDGSKIPDDQNPDHWSLYQIQQHILTIEANQANQAKSLQASIDQIKHNPVPVGFIYIQLSGQPEPGQIWPGLQWQHITANYAGKFFRAEGAGSASFGQVQGENAPRLAAVHKWNAFDVNDGEYGINPGAWTPKILTGNPGPHGHDHPDALSFLVSGGEVRPANQAIRIWRRSG